MATERDWASADERRWPQISLSVVLLTLGVVLVIASFFPVGRLVTNRLWTTEDAIAYDRISLEYHRSALQSTPRSGRTEEEMAEQLAKLKRQFNAMHERLEHAHRQPQLWRRYLLWSGALLAVAGGVSHLRESHLHER